MKAWIERDLNSGAFFLHNKEPVSLLQTGEWESKSGDSGEIIGNFPELRRVLKKGQVVEVDIKFKTVWEPA